MTQLKDKFVWPWLVWLSWLGLDLQKPKRLRFHFQSRAHAWVLAHSEPPTPPTVWCLRETTDWWFSHVSPSPPPSKNKVFCKKNVLKRLCLVWFNSNQQIHFLENVLIELLICVESWHGSLPTHNHFVTHGVQFPRLSTPTSRQKIWYIPHGWLSTLWGEEQSWLCLWKALCSTWTSRFNHKSSERSKLS